MIRLFGNYTIGDTLEQFIDYSIQISRQDSIVLESLSNQGRKSQRENHFRIIRNSI
jgi:hypothetical protein